MTNDFITDRDCKKYGGDVTFNILSLLVERSRPRPLSPTMRGSAPSLSICRTKKTMYRFFLLMLFAQDTQIA